MILTSWLRCISRCFVCSCALLFFLSLTISFISMFFSSGTRMSEWVLRERCEHSQPCLVNPISSISFNSSEAVNSTSTNHDTYRPYFDLYVHEREIDVCVLPIMHKSSKEREFSFSLSVSGVRFNYHIVHVYSINDDLPVDKRSNYIVYPEEADYDTLLKKVFFGLEYFMDNLDSENMKCDFVMKMDDDFHVNWMTFSWTLLELGPRAWIGRYYTGGPVNLHQNSKWYDISYVLYTGLRRYNVMFFGQMYAMGRELFQCMITEGRRRNQQEEGYLEDEKKWINLHNEDVAMGLLGQQCEYDVKDLNGRYFGEELRSFYNPSWAGLIGSHVSIEERESNDPLWTSI